MALPAFMAHPCASPRTRRFVIGLPLVRGSRLVAGPLFTLKVSTVGAASWHGPVETGTGAATTFGMVTGAVSSTTPGSFLTRGSIPGTTGMAITHTAPIPIDDDYDDDGSASSEYSQEPYPAQSEYDNGNPDSSVSQVQAALARKGYYHGAIDGRLGPGTRNALRRYQRNHGLDVTGRVDRPVIEALGLRYASRLR